MRRVLLGLLVLMAAGPVAAGDPPPPAVAKASSGAVPPATPPAAEAAPELDARAWELVDARDGEPIVSHAAAQRLPIASTTKLMTAYVALKELPLDRIVRAAPYEAEYGESLLELRPGQRISVRDLLYGLILRSGNDAAYDLALAAAGSERGFVRQMNRYAAALGLSDTHFTNPIGLDQRGNYSSARDLMALTRRLLAIPVFAHIADSRSAVLRSVQPRRRIESINELLFMRPWVTGVKTGHTFGALYVLVGAGRRKGVELISTTIGVPTDEDRYDDNLALLEYGFRQYDRRVPIQAGEGLAKASVRYQDDELSLRAARRVVVGLRRGQRLAVDVSAPSEVQGPLRRGAVLGRATVLVGGRRAATVALRAARDVPAASVVDRVRTLVDSEKIPIAIAVCVILIGAVITSRLLR